MVQAAQGWSSHGLSAGGGLDFVSGLLWLDRGASAAAGTSTNTLRMLRQFPLHRKMSGRRRGGGASVKPITAQF